MQFFGGFKVSSFQPDFDRLDYFYKHLSLKLSMEETQEVVMPKMAMAKHHN